MTETQYWQRLRKYLIQHVYVWKINAAYAKGIPDWYGSGIDQDLWVENKRVVGQKPPVSLDLTDHKKYLSLHQQQWLEGRHEEGRNVGVIVFSEVGHIYLPGLKFKERISRLTFMEEAMSYQELADHLVAILGKKEVK